MGGGGHASLLGVIFGNTSCKAAFDCTPRLDKYGGIFLWFGLMVYMFKALGTICDEYFVPALEVIVEKLQLSNDVAGATFMAAGSSAPELFTSLVATFLIVNEGGVGTIIGSAIFNILVIVGATGVVACKDQTLKIWWYPLSRDCFFYVVSIAELMGILIDEKVEWWEALIMIITYILYCIYMKFNPAIVRLCRISKPFEDSVEEASDELAPSHPAGLDIVVLGAVEDGTVADRGHDGEVALAPPKSPGALRSAGSPPPSPSRHLRFAGDSTGDAPSPGVARDFGTLAGSLEVEDLDRTDVAGHPLRSPRWSFSAAEGQHPSRGPSKSPRGDGIPPHHSPPAFAGFGAHLDVPGAADDDNERSPSKNSRNVSKSTAGSAGAADSLAGAADSGVAADSGGAADSEEIPAVPQISPRQALEEEIRCSPKLETLSLTGPEPDVFCGLFRCYDPITVCWEKTMPNPDNYCWSLFTLSILYIGLCTYIMVDATNRIGLILRIPALVMGLIFLAAGTSIPDALGSIAVAKQGEGDMAVSNALGSNVFDILIGLGVPWMIRCVTGQKVEFPDAFKDLVVDIVILVVFLVLFVGALAINGWNLTRRTGIMLLSLYVVYVFYNLLMVFAFKAKGDPDDG